MSSVNAFLSVSECLEKEKKSTTEVEAHTG